MPSGHAPGLEKIYHADIRKIPSPGLRASPFPLSARVIFVLSQSSTIRTLRSLREKCRGRRAKKYVARFRVCLFRISSY